MKNLEKKIINELGFKKKWLSDKSGYWLSKKYKFAGLKLYFSIDKDNKEYPILVYMKTNMSGEFEENHVDIQKHKKRNLNFKFIKNLDKKFLSTAKFIDKKWK
jgi:hypothetical protein